jgi:SPFH domain / Band 7 family
MDVPVMSKTKGDATVTVPVRVQYYVLPDKVKEAYYELDDPEDQIKAHVENVILSYIPEINLDDTYQQEDQIARRIKESLATVMALLMMTQYFDALRDMERKATPFCCRIRRQQCPTFTGRWRNAITAGNLAAAKSMEKPPEKK